MLVVQSLKVHSHTQRDHISLIFCNMSKAVILQLDWIYAEVLLLYPAAVLLLSQTAATLLCHKFSVFYSYTRVQYRTSEYSSFGI